MSPLEGSTQGVVLDVGGLYLQACFRPSLVCSLLVHRELGRLSNKATALEEAGRSVPEARCVVEEQLLLESIACSWGTAREPAFRGDKRGTWTERRGLTGNLVTPNEIRNNRPLKSKEEFLCPDHCEFSAQP